MYYRGYVELKQNCRSGFSKYDIEDSEKRFDDLQNCSIATLAGGIAGLGIIFIIIVMNDKGKRGRPMKPVNIDT